MISTGTADLPLHHGRAPRWLFKRMVRLSGAITEVIIDEYGRDEFLRRITDPHWFQALACTIGFDWHSSGTTTTTCGALKVALDPQEHGIAVLGGKGGASRKTPDEISTLDERLSISHSKIEELIYDSKMTAKVDNSLIQDEFQLYHHSFFVIEDGDWGVVQQGMFDKEGYARRYHWLSEGVEDLVEEPHTGICCDHQFNRVLDMTSRKSGETRQTSLDLINDNPDHLRRYFGSKKQTTLIDYENNLEMPKHHPVLDMDISERGWRILKGAYEFQPSDYEELVSLKGMGPKKIRALALVSDLIHGTRASWEDPVKYSFAHGGKDGTPFPVDRDVYDHTIDTLKDAIHRSEVGDKDKKYALRRLNEYLPKDAASGIQPQCL
ncbi:MAG: DUF763 domain-containing protein [Thermoplasmata archaeon]